MVVHPNNPIQIASYTKEYGELAKVDMAKVLTWFRATKEITDWLVDLVHVPRLSGVDLLAEKEQLGIQLSFVASIEDRASHLGS